jgi:hypothetical protein
MFPKSEKRDETTPKIEKNVGTFTGGGVKKHVRWALRRRRTMREKKEEEKEALSSR